MVLIPKYPGFGADLTNPVDYTLLAISLRDGKRLWSQVLHYVLFSAGDVHIGDIDGDGRPEVVTLEQCNENSSNPNPRIRPFDGRDGKVLWTWRPPERRWVEMVLADFGRKRDAKRLRELLWTASEAPGRDS